jgi:hypothetical protein
VTDHPHQVEPARPRRCRHRRVLLRVLEQASQGGGLLADLAQEHRPGTGVGLQLRRRLRVHLPCSRGLKTGTAGVRSRRLSSVTRR